MKILFFLMAAAVWFPACSQKQKSKQQATATSFQGSKASQIVQGTYLCWQNSGTSLGGRRVVGEIRVVGNSYGGGTYGKGTYKFDPATKMVRFNGGGFDQRKNGEEWVGLLYAKRR